MYSLISIEMTVKYCILFVHLTLKFTSAKIYTSITRADYAASTETALIDIQILNASILQCNVHCVTDSNCDAFTVQKSATGSFKYDFNVCKLQTISNSSTVNQNSSDSEAITMFINRGPTYDVPPRKRTTTRSTPISSTTSSTTISTTLTTSTATTTVTVPTAAPLPKNADYLLTAIDELDSDKYMLFWSDITSSAKPLKLTIVAQSNPSGPVLQDLVFTDIFTGFSGTMIITVFTVNGITYICNASNVYFKYQINKGPDGLILSAVKVTGTITNTIVTKSVYMTTGIGNSSVLIRQQDTKTFCFHIDVVNTNQIMNPPPSADCQAIAQQLSKDTSTTMTSSVGHDAASLRILYNSKMNPYDAD